MGLQFSITAIGSIMLQSANNALGTACVAAFTAAMRIKMFVMCPLDSLGMAMATYSGQNYGAGKPDRIWMGIKSATLMMLVYSVAIAIVMWGLADKFALLFISPDETEIMKDTVLFLHINTSFFILLGSLSILRYTIQGAGYTRLAMFRVFQKWWPVCWSASSSYRPGSSGASALATRRPGCLPTCSWCRLSSMCTAA